MGIQHLEDLTPDQIRDAMTGTLRVTSKIDGSFLAFGFDEHNRFYTERKSGQRFYTLDEWPNEGWSQGFRQAHVVLDAYMDYLQSRNVAGRYARATCEVVNGNQPNVVDYGYANGIIIHPHTNFEASGFECTISINQLHSDGLLGWVENDEIKWKVSKINVLDWRGFPVQEAQGILDWLALPSKVKPYNMEAVLGFKFNRRPDGYTKEAWKTSLPLLKAERERIREAYAYRMNLLRRKCVENLNERVGYSGYHSHSLNEGYVVSTTTGVLFKVIYREWFTAANAFAHWVRYALIGGRRPERPSFESRTRDWPLEKRLDRLEVLRQRFLANHKKLVFHWPTDKRPGEISYSDDIYDRTLMLFYDLRERLKDGRAGIQRKHKADPHIGDHTYTALAGDTSGSTETLPQ